MTRLGRDGLSREALEALMAFLGKEPDVAASEYLRLRQRLIKILEIRGARHKLRATPEDLADETIERVARQLEQGLAIQAEDPFRYFLGVARYVVRETSRAEVQAGESLEDHGVSLPAPDTEPSAVADRERCLALCLSELSPKDRELILQFYSADRGRSRIAHRKRLAKKLGLSPNALRIRAFRLRRQFLEPCINRCLETASGEGQ